MARKSPTAAIFAALKGSWRLKRSLDSALPNFPSGIFEGTATFTPKEPSAHSVAAELLYSEIGELRTVGGLTLKANRKYIYRYDADEDQISAWFVKEDTKNEDGKEEVDNLFHHIETESKTQHWIGRGEHLCDKDMYWAMYDFRLPQVAEEGQEMNMWGLRFKTLDQLKRVSIFCFNLTIKVGYDKQKKGTRVSFSRNGLEHRSSVERRREDRPRCPIQATARREWAAIFSSFQQLTELTLVVGGDPGWLGRTDIEETLISLRIALENAQPYNLLTVRLTPIHGMGMIHMRWSSFGAFGSSPATSYQLWHKLSMLDLQLRNPLLPKFQLSLSQQVMFKKLLYSYLRSFSTTLTSLRFVWLDGLGPNPLTLELEPELQGGQQDGVVWQRLQKLWVGGVLTPHSVVRCARQRCPALTSFKTLRSVARDSALLLSEVGDSGAWIEV
ncbi:hypothetical protein K431DRAFT_200047, partial [Polychaeton citri CBS 116435]